jgi:hypothetical protein
MNKKSIYLRVPVSYKVQSKKCRIHTKIKRKKSGKSVNINYNIYTAFHSSNISNEEQLCIAEAA